MKKIISIILVTVLLSVLCGCSNSNDISPYEEMDIYLDRNGWDNRELLNYAKDRGFLSLSYLMENEYIDADDIMNYLSESGVLSEYGYIEEDGSGELSKYEAAEYRNILQEIAYIMFSYEDGVSKTEIFDQIYDIINNCTDTMGDIVLN